MKFLRKWAIFAAVFSAHAAWACSVCATGKEEARFAYYGTTALLSLLPLAMIGGVVVYIVKKSR